MKLRKKACAPIAAVVLLALAACTPSLGKRESYPGEPGRVTRPLPREPGTAAPVPLPDAYSPIPTEIPPGAPQRAEDVSGPAVQALIDQARGAQGTGNLPQAVAALERALRIEPRNPFVWQMLASAHLALGQVDQAEAYAEKSNSLARGNPYVEVENWKTIAAAKAAQGDAESARVAQARADELGRLVGQ